MEVTPLRRKRAFDFRPDEVKRHVDIWTEQVKNIDRALNEGKDKNGNTLTEREITNKRKEGHRLNYFLRQAGFPLFESDHFTKDFE